MSVISFGIFFKTFLGLRDAGVSAGVRRRVSLSFSGSSLSLAAAPGGRSSAAGGGGAPVTAVEQTAAAVVAAQASEEVCGARGRAAAALGRAKALLLHTRLPRLLALAGRCAATSR